MELLPTVILNSGYNMPRLALGTASAVSLTDDELVEIFLASIKVGYRHIDTAACYSNEKAIGKAVSKAVEQKIVSSREDLFITSKLWGTDAEAHLVYPAIKKSLENLGLDYLDLFLIHWPVRLRKKDRYFPIHKDDILPYDVRTTWAAMEECQRLGLAHSIGVSNFSSKKLSDLLGFATIPPAVNQVEMNPLWNPNRLRDFCNENNIQITAYSPLGANGAPWGTIDVMNCPTLKNIALAKEKSLPQICLRWLFEQGVTIVVKSYNKDRMKENLQIFDWELTEEDNHKISKIPQKRGCPGDMFISPNGPYKSIEQLWDGEI